MEDFVMDMNASYLASGNRSDFIEESPMDFGIETTPEYIYDYNFTDVISSDDLWDVVPTAIIYSLTFLLGIVGNILIIFTIARYRRMRTITNVFLMSLASADLLLILLCVPVKMAKLISFTWTFGEFPCKAVHYMQNVSAICSVFTMTSMSLERYYAILHPMKAKYICTISQARKVIASIWMSSFIAAIPIIFVQVHLVVGERKSAYWCIRNWDNVIAWQCYEVFMLFIILVIPVNIMGYAYFNICREVWHVMQIRATMTGGEMRNGKDSARAREMYPMTALDSTHNSNSCSRSNRNTLKTEEENTTVKQVIKMLVAVVVLFIICWTPLITNDVLTAFNYLDYQSTGSLKTMRMVVTAMAYLNSCMNPIVYGFMSRNFRQSFLSAVSSCRPGRHLRQMSVSHTRTTSVSLGRSLSVSTRDY